MNDVLFILGLERDGGPFVDSLALDGYGRLKDLMWSSIIVELFW